MSAATAAKLEAEVSKLKRDRHNKKCFTCAAGVSTYIVTPHYIFVCDTCSGLLRQREFECKARGISMTSWTREDVASIKKGGNKLARKEWLRGLDKDFPKPDSNDKQALLKFLTDIFVAKKYVKRRKKKARSGTKPNTPKSADTSAATSVRASPAPSSVDRTPVFASASPPAATATSNAPASAAVDDDDFDNIFAGEEQAADQKAEALSAGASTGGLPDLGLVVEEEESTANPSATTVPTTSTARPEQTAKRQTSPDIEASIFDDLLGGGEDEAMPAQTGISAPSLGPGVGSPGPIGDFQATGTGTAPGAGLPMQPGLTAGSNAPRQGDLGLASAQGRLRSSMVSPTAVTALVSVFQQLLATRDVTRQQLPAVVQQALQQVDRGVVNTPTIAPSPAQSAAATTGSMGAAAPMNNPFAMGSVGAFPADEKTDNMPRNPFAEDAPGIPALDPSTPNPFAALGGMGSGEGASSTAAQFGGSQGDALSQGSRAAVVGTASHAATLPTQNGIAGPVDGAPALARLASKDDIFAFADPFKS